MVNAFLPFWGLLKRELIRDLRRPRPMMLLGGVMCIAFFVVAGNYPSGQISPMAMGMRSGVILGGLSGTLLAAAIFLLPGYAATAIVVERETDTYDLLSLTLTRPSFIVLGKLASALGYYLLIVLALLPFIATTLFIVGVDAQTIVYAAIYLGIVAVTCASMGIMSSAVVRSTPRAVVLAYMSTFIALAGYLVPFGLLMLLVEILRLKALEPLALGVFRFFASLSPFGSLGMLASGFSSPFFTMSRIALGQGAFSLLALLVARRMLTQTNEERSFTSYSAPPPLPAMRGKHAPVNFFDDRVLPPWPPVRDHANPMLARELLQMRIGQRMTPLRLMLIAICILPIILVLAYAMNESGFRVRARDAHTVVHAWIIGLTVLMAFVAPGSCAAAWSREYERETMDLLRTALLTPRQLVYGKVIAALRACALPLILAATASLPLIPYPIASGHALIMFATGLVTIGVTTVECVAVATLMGLLSRRTTASILYGYAGSMAAICLPFLINAAIVLVTIFRTRDDFLIPWWHLSPITTYAYQLSPASQLHASSLTIWASCMVAQLLFAGVVLRVSVALVTARHLQDN